MLGAGWGGGTGYIRVHDNGVLDLFQLHGDGSSSKSGALNISKRVLYGFNYILCDRNPPSVAPHMVGLAPFIQTHRDGMHRLRAGYRAEF